MAIAWVTSLSPDEHWNAAPFSFFNALGANPLVGIYVAGVLSCSTRASAFDIVGRFEPVGIRSPSKPAAQKYRPKNLRKIIPKVTI